MYITTGYLKLFMAKTIALIMLTLALVYQPSDAIAESHNFVKGKVLTKKILKIGKSKDLISLEVFRSAGSPAESGEELKAEAKLISAGKVISSVQFEPIWSSFEGIRQYDVDGKVLSDKGFTGHPILVSFHFQYPACDYQYGDVLLVLKDKRLSYGLTAAACSNEQTVGSYSYIFPNNKKGKKDNLTVVYSNRDAETNQKRVKDELEVYLWNGQKFRKISKD